MKREQKNIIEKAVRAMEIAMVYMHHKKRDPFYFQLGQAQAYAKVLQELFNYRIALENEHYRKMQDRALEASYTVLGATK